MIEFYPDLDQYTNVQGLVTNQKGRNKSSGNDLLYTAEAIRVAFYKLEYSGWVLLRNSLTRSIYTVARISEGLYKRPGFWQDSNEAVDDYVGLCSISPEIAKGILAYGKEHRWYFKTTPFAKWYEPLFWRWPAFMAHAHWGAGVTPNAFLRLCWCISVALSGNNKETDAWKLSYLLVETAPYRGIEKFANEIFWRRLKRNWGSMKAVYTAYFGADHPIAKYCEF